VKSRHLANRYYAWVSAEIANSEAAAASNDVRRAMTATAAKIVPSNRPPARRPFYCCEIEPATMSRVTPAPAARRMTSSTSARVDHDSSAVRVDQHKLLRHKNAGTEVLAHRHSTTRLSHYMGCSAVMRSIPGLTDGERAGAIALRSSVRPCGFAIAPSDENP